MSIELGRVLEAIMSANDVFTYFYDTETGETVYISDGMVVDGVDEKLSELIEISNGRFLRFPTQYDINDYKIMEEFVYSLPPGTARHELGSAICGKGAFRRFKSGIRYHQLEQRWYGYRDRAYREIAVQWCREQGLGYIEEL